jgi:hypothetical protein
MDKENVNFLNRQEDAPRSFAFNSLLMDASKDLHNSLSEKAALSVKSREERLMRKEQEEDEEEAKRLQQLYEDEYVTWIIHDQEEKLRVYREGVEKEREEGDRRLCHRLVMEEEEALYAKKVTEEEDYRFAKDVQHAVERELEEEERKERMLAADAKFARELSESWAKEERDMKRRGEAEDKAVAKSLAKQEQRSFHRAKVTRNRLLQKQVEEDAKFARQVAEGKDWEEEDQEGEGKEEKTQGPSLREFKHWCEDLTDQWEDPPLQVDNVHSGICLVLHLPHLLDIQLGTKGRNSSIVCVSAKRMKNQQLVSTFCKGQMMGRQASWEEEVFEKKHQVFQAEFSFENVLNSDENDNENNSESKSERRSLFSSLRKGGKHSKHMSIEAQDVSYDYSSSTGDLFVYIDDIALSGNEQEEEEEEGEEEGKESEKKTSSLFTSFRKVLGFRER